MRTKSKIFSSFFILALLVGCNTADEGENTREETNSNNLSEAAPNVDQTITQEDTAAVNNQHANERTDVVNNQGGEEVSALTQFMDFELDVEYANDISFEVDYENDEKGIKAEIEDEVNNVYLSGDEAKNSLIKNFEQLTFDENTAETEIVTQILTAFNLTDDFIKMELEVRYPTGTVKEYNFKN